jgi:hypothetical protein
MNTEDVQRVSARQHSKSKPQSMYLAKHSSAATGVGEKADEAAAQMPVQSMKQVKHYIKYAATTPRSDQGNSKIAKHDTTWQIFQAASQCIVINGSTTTLVKGYQAGISHTREGLHNTQP